LYAYVRWFGDLDWPATILLFLPRWPAVFPGITLALFALLGKRFGWVAINLTLSLLALVFVGAFNVPIAESCPEGERIRVASYNIGGAGYDDLQRLIAENVDVAFLQEPNQMCAEAESLARYRPYRFLSLTHLCLMTRLGIESADERPPDDFFKRAGMGVMATSILTTSKLRFALTGTHLETPREGFQLTIYRNPEAEKVFEDKLQIRNEESKTLRQWVDRKKDIPRLVMGDFNYPQESALYRRDWQNWQNAFGKVGWGFGHTKKARLMGVRIDHVLADENWCVEAAQPGQGFSGDHSPMIVDLVAKPK
jgi:vancomycin resistance protein VanJ